MSEVLQGVNPLGGAVAEEGLACRIEEVAGRGMILLRGDLDSEKIRETVSSIAKVKCPEVRKIGLSGDSGAAWMSPDELLIFLPRAEVPAAISALHEALKGEHYQAVDMSDARAVLRLTGGASREVLAKGAPVDLARGSFGLGDWRRTRLGQVAVAFGQVKDDPETFDLVCFRSVSEFVFAWLKTAAREGSMPEFL